MKSRLSPKALAIALGVLVVAVTSSYAASDFISKRFADRPTPKDLVLNAVPYIGSAQYLADATVSLAIVVLAVYVISRMPRKLPEAVSLFGLMYFTRSLLIVLTPLASPHGASEYGLLPPQYGMFPSGHAAAVLLCVWLVDKREAPRLRAVMLTLAVVEWAMLLLSRGHYSIDIVGGMLLTYFIYNEWTRGRMFGILKEAVQAP